MEVKQLEAFVRVAWTSSYTLASHDLGITQPAVSTRVAGLEQELGTPLFVRRQGKVHLTAAGEQFRAYAEEILHMIREAGNTVSGNCDPPGSAETLRLGCNTATAAGALAGWLRAYRSSYSPTALQVDVIVDRTPVLMSMLMQGEIELVLGSPDLIDPLAQVLWSRTTTLTLVAGRHYQGRRDGLTAADLAQVEFVAFTNGAARRQLWRLERTLGGRLRVAFSSNSALLVRMLIAAGDAVGFMPSETVVEELASGELVELSLAPGEIMESWEAVLVRWRDRPLSLAATRLVAELPSLVATA